MESRGMSRTRRRPTRTARPARPQVSRADVAAVRRFNRAATRFAGALARGYLGTPFTLQEARVLFEVGRGPGLSSGEVQARLGIDQAFLSRLLSRLDRRGLLVRGRSVEDARRLELRLTPSGMAAWRQLQRRADADVTRQLAPLPPDARRRLVEAMGAVERILAGDVEPQAPDPSKREAVRIRTERVGDLGWTFHRQAVVYAEEFGYSRVFEAYVCRGLPPYLDQRDPARDRLWVAELDGRPVGFIAVHHADDRPGWAKLRWFLVEAEARGHGVGRRLMETALRFCRRAGYSGVFLWTVDDLHAARALYARAGFRLAQQTGDCPWKPGAHEQEWELRLKAGRAS
jgi:DNA-binding MarR family transcriptional regulator/GNAT superfamily N-acetyltransferase